MMEAKFAPKLLRQILALVAALLILKVTIATVLKYCEYFPPNFNSDFLRGREAFFFGSYSWAFYVHIASGPIALVLGLILISDRFRQRFRAWHRRLGRVQAAGVLFLVAPSGLWMAYHAEGGPVAAVGFSALAIATGTCTALGWRAAVQRRFPEHRRWMWRTFLLLCSAVVIRVIGGLGAVTGIHNAWIDPVDAWGCWLIPLAVFELGRARNGSIRSPPVRAGLATVGE
jgi:hypothetical protein